MNNSASHLKQMQVELDMRQNVFTCMWRYTPQIFPGLPGHLLL